MGNCQNDMACWRDAGKQARLLGEPQIVPGPDATKIDVSLAIGSGGAQLAMSYEVSATAGIIIDAQWRPAAVDGSKIAISGGVACLRCSSASCVAVEGKVVRAPPDD